MTVEPVLHRKPLRWDEVPLPLGYPRSVLDAAVKERLKAQHADRVRQAMEERAFIIKKAAEDVVYQEKVLVLCERDPAWWINHFVWTYDDRVGTDEPLVLYPFQEEKFVEPYKQMVSTTGHARWTRAGTKSRALGATIVSLALRTHSFQFKESWSILLGAVTRDDVDDGGLGATHLSLMGKVRYIIGKQPRWMRDRLLGPLFARDDYNKRYLLRNPTKPRNLMAGKQLSGMFGRGQRFSEVFADEIAWSEEMEAADTSLKQTTNRFEGVSTPQGKHTFHYQLVSGSLPGVQTYVCHWSEHPELDLAWYNEQREHMTEEQVAQELDCSFDASAGGRVLKEVGIDSHFTLVEPELAREEELQKQRRPLLGAYDPALPLIVVIDPGIADPMAVVWAQWDAGRAEGRIVDFVQTQDRTLDWCVPFIIGRVPEATHRGQPWQHAYGPVEERIIRRHALWGPPTEVYGDHYGIARGLTTGLSAYDDLEPYGISVFPVKIDDDLQAIAHLELIMRYFRFPSRLIEQRNGPPETCPTMGEVVTQWRFPRRRADDHRLVTKPVHDKFCHGGDTLKMLAKRLLLPEATQQPVDSGRVRVARGSDVVGGPKRIPAFRRRFR